MPDYVEAHNNLGNALCGLEQLDAALQAGNYRKLAQMSLGHALCLLHPANNPNHLAYSMC